MTYHPLILADSGFLFAYYSARDKHHQQVRRFFESKVGWVEARNPT